MATEVHNELVSRQTGQPMFDEIEMPAVNQAELPDFSDIVIEDDDERPAPMRLNPSLMFDPTRISNNTNVAREAEEAGWGSSRYDRGSFVPGQDTEDRRAIEQPGFWKIMNGAAKGGVTALTTAVTTTAGIIDGLLEGGYELAREIATGEPVNLGNIGDRAVNNFFANQALNIQKLSEEWFPNYRTQEERSDRYQEEWWKHIGTANFIGDSFLKNFGFTVGAMAASAGWTSVLGRGMAKNISGDLMKGVVAAADGDAAASEALQNTLKLVQSGAAKTVDAKVLADNIQNAARQVNKMNSKLQLFGSVLAAMGEGTMEGTMARDEFMENFRRDIKDEYLQSLNNLDEQIISESEDYGIPSYYIDENGETRVAYQLNEKGLARKEELKRNLAEQYGEIMQFANEEGDRLASTTFLLNTLILTPSNAFQFGRMFAGGWKTARNNLSRIAGKMAFDSAGRPVVNYRGRGNAVLGGLAKSLKVGMAEAAEELAQGYISSGEKRIADNRIAAFNNDGYDRTTLRSIGEWFRGMNEGGWDYLSDSKNWQEGFLGAVTGLLGIPGKHWNGGVPEAVRESRAKVEASKRSAEELNKNINSQEFRDRWLGYVRHQKYDREMAEAVISNDQYAWHGADDKQLINDVLMFADAGRLQDLLDVVDNFSSLNDEQAKAIGVVEMMTSKENEKDVQNNQTEYINKAREKATDIKTVIQQYKDMYDALSARMPIETTPDHLRELLFTTMQIKRYEKRFLDLFGETMQSLENTFVEDVNSAPELKGASDITLNQKLQELRTIYTKAFTQNVYPGIIGQALRINTARELQTLEKRVSNDQELLQKVQDLRKLSEDRQRFYDKMVTLQNISSQEYEAKAMTPEKASEQTKKEEIETQTEGLKTIADVKNAFNAVEYGKQDDFVRDIETVRQSNPAADEFIKLYRTYRDFLEYHADKARTPVDQKLITQIFNNAASESAFVSLDPEIIPSPEAFHSALADKAVRGFTKESANAAYYAALGNIRKVMSDFNAMRGKSSMPTLGGAESGRPVMPKGAPTLDMLEKGLQDGKGDRDAPQPGNESPEPQGVQPGNGETAEKPTREKQEKSEPEPVSDVKTDNELVSEYVPETEPVSPEVDEQINARAEGKITYYRTSMPEIDSREAAKARAAMNIADPAARKMTMNQINLANFHIANPGFGEIWTALYDYSDGNQPQNAFENVAKRVKKDDKVKFVIDKNFPNWKDDKGVEHQSILVCLDTGNDNEYVVLSTLSGQTGKYYGLSELRQAILNDYRANANPGERYYTFPKRSTVFFKQNGIINYRPMMDDKAIIDTPGYEDSDPIVFIDKGGNIQVVRGDKKAVLDMYPFSIPSNQPNYMQKLRGNLYYLVKDARGKYIPIRLNIEHFKPETAAKDLPVFNAIRESISNIAKISYDALRDYGVPGSRETAIEKGNDSLHKEVAKLKELLAMNDIFLNLGVSESGTPLLKTVQNYGSGEQREVYKDFNMQQLADSSHLEDWFESLGKSLNVKAVEDEFGNVTIPNLSRFVDQGLITTNAEVLWPKGSDFYFQPWIPSSNDFQKQKTNNKAKMLYGDQQEASGFNEVPPQTVEPTIPQSSMPAEPEKDMPNVRLNIKKRFTDLSKDVQDELLDEGITEEEFNRMSAEAQNQKLSCLGI